MTTPRRRSNRYASHPLEGTCPLCDEPLGGNTRLRKWRGVWAHWTCILTARGE